MMVTRRSRENREVRRSSDTTIRYTVSGPATGPTVALVHGWGCNREDYDALTDFLPDDYRVIAVDLAEHGESRSTRAVWTVREFGQDVAAVLKAESVDRCTVVGHSLGGAVAVEVGRLLPDTVARIIALDALHYLFLFGAVPESQVEELMRPAHDDFPGLVRSMVEAGSPPGTDPELKSAYFEQMVAVRQPAGTRAFEGLLLWDMDDALAHVTQPITVFGVRALVTQEALDRLGDRLDLVLVDLGTHHFLKESPEATAKLIADAMGA